MDRHGSGFFVHVDEVDAEGVEVAVEDDAYQLSGAVDDGAAGVAADDVGGADEGEDALRQE
ncbi:MAG: hypothetical protein JWL69_1383 [Phycisphaerales bacterium]|nr:hypothetical protein [Phycisphaerales bacterium]MDB5353720.1 hypothetical protein [Phycisphaerales bacterium]